MDKTAEKILEEYSRKFCYESGYGKNTPEPRKGEEIIKFFRNKLEEYHALRSREDKERIEQLEKALIWAKDVFMRLADEGHYPEFLLQENGGEGIMPIISALSGKSKENL